MEGKYANTWGNAGKSELSSIHLVAYMLLHSSPPCFAGCKIQVSNAIEIGTYL